MKGRAIGTYGFTLIELMVSVLLLGMMGMLLMSAINSSLVAKEAVEEISDRYHMVRQAMSRMAREISMAYLSKHINLSDPAYMTQFKGSKESLFFSAFGNVVRQQNAKQGDQQVLGFFLRSDKDGHQSLMRRAKANLNLDVEKGGLAQVLCPKVSKLEFAYFDDRMEKWDEGWISDPSGMVAIGELESRDDDERMARHKQSLPKDWRLPKFVRISLTAEMSDGQEMTWVTETEIRLTEPLDLK